MQLATILSCLLICANNRGHCQVIERGESQAGPLCLLENYLIAVKNINKFLFLFVGSTITVHGGD